jgi:hypothetical protein
MRRWWLLLAWLLIPAIGLAQATPKVYWEHDGLNVTSFQCVVDGGHPADLGLPTPSGTTYSAEIASCTGVLVNGQHSLTIQACNEGGCTAATAMTVVKL